MLSRIAEQFAIFAILDRKPLPSRIAEQFAIFAILDSNTFAIQESRFFKKLLSLGTFTQDLKKIAIQDSNFLLSRIADFLKSFKVWGHLFHFI